MAQWVRLFVIPDVADVHALFRDDLLKAERLQQVARGTTLQGPANAILAELRRTYLDFNSELRASAEQAAVRARTDIVAHLNRLQVRPDTRTSPHLRNLIYCAPLNLGGLAETGAVGIARVSTLERAINRNTPGYGSYWRAQEFGTGGSEVPSQVGRVIYGYFASGGGGDLEPPRAQYAGGGGPHPIFLPARPQARTFAAGQQGARAALAGGNGVAGLGTISHEIQPKRFVSVGADDAALQWRNRIQSVQQRAIDRLSAIGAP